MNKVQYAGRRVSSFERYDEIGPITGVSILLDSESEPINAGNDTGYVLEISCPYGTEAIAADILAKVQGKKYKGFRAENAILPPDAELGDYVNVNYDTYPLAYMKTTCGPGHMSDIAAPGENTPEHEYSWVSPEKKEFKKNLSYVQSEISKNSSNITLLVKEVHGDPDDEDDNGLIGQYSSLSVELGKIALEVHGENGNGGLAGSYSAISQKVDNITLSVTNTNGTVSIQLKSGDSDLGTAGSIDLTGMVTFSALNSAPGAGTTTKINGGWIDTNTLTVNAAKITGTLSIGTIPDGVAKTGDIPTDVSELGNSLEYVQKNNMTSIVGGIVTTEYINARNVTAVKLSGEEIGLMNGATQFGTITMKSGNTYALDISSKTSLRLQSGFGYNTFIGNNNGPYLFLTGSPNIPGASKCKLINGALVIGSASYGTGNPPNTGQEEAGQVYFKLVS